MGAMRNLSRTLVLCAAVLLLAAYAQATPLGLQVGDVIDTIEWDALDINSDGGNFTAATQELFTTGLISNVDVNRAPAFPPNLTSLPQTGVTFTFGVQLLNAAVLPAPGPNTLNLLTLWEPSNLTDPDVSIYENGDLVLFGDFTPDSFGDYFYFGGKVNLLDPEPTLIATGNISVDGGNSLLVNAIGDVATLELTASVFGFNAPLSELLEDNIAGNEDFFVEFSGTLRPANATPFVPEPGTMALLGVGLLGLLAVGRRRNR